MRNVNRSATLSLLALALAGAGCSKGGTGSGSSSTAASTAATATTTTTTTTTPRTGTTPPLGTTPVGPTSPVAVVPAPSPVPGAVAPRAVSRWVYVANIGDDTVTQYSIDATTGALTIVGAPYSVPAGSQPSYLASDPAGRFLYCALPGNSGQVMSFQIKPDNTGTLIAGPVANAGVGCNACMVDPTGTLLLTSDEFGDSVSSFPIDQTTGALGTRQVAQLPTGSEPSFVAIDPSGKFAYAANYSTNNVSVISIEAGTGKLAVVGSPVACGASPFVLTTDPSGAHVYVGCAGAISTFNRDAATGAITPQGQGSVPISTQGGVLGMAMDPQGKFLYVSCGTTGSTSSLNSFNTFAVDPVTSALVELTPPALLGTASIPFFMGVDQSATFAYAPDYQNNVILTFKADPTTGDMAATGTPLPAGNQPGAALVLK